MPPHLIVNERSVEGIMTYALCECGMSRAESESVDPCKWWTG